jgi:hypothetical protein
LTGPEYAYRYVDKFVNLISSINSNDGYRYHQRKKSYSDE